MRTNESDFDPAVKPRRSVWPVAICLGCIILVCALVRHFESHRYGDSRRRPETLLNLREIDLATHNYAAQHVGNLPPHALVGSEGTEHFGWAIFLLPYLDRTAIYDHFDLDKPWNDRVNRDPASVSVNEFLNPRVNDRVEESTYGMLHYAANSRVFDSGKLWSLEEISSQDGLTNTIFYGEIVNHFRPWAAPGSLRDPAEGFGDGPNQYGGPNLNLVLFAFGDGSANSVNLDIDPKILKALATPDGGEVVPPDW